MRIKLTCKNIKTDQTLIVNYNPHTWDHDVFENGEFLGKLRLRELFFNGFECVGKEFSYGY